MATITTEKFGDLTFDGSQRLYGYNNSGQTVGLQLKFGDQEYTFVPQNILEKGFQKDNTQYYLGNILKDDNLKALGTEGQYIDLAGVADYDTYLPNKGLSTTGFLLPSSVASERKLLTSVRKYDIGKDLGKGMQMGEIQGVSEIGGKPVYVTTPMGKAQSTWIQPPGTSGYDGQNVTGTSQGRYTYTRNNFGFIGEIASGIGQAVGGVPFLPELIGFATGQPLLAAGLRGAAAGAAGMDPLKAGLLSGVSAAGVASALPGPTPAPGVDYSLTAGGADVGGTGFQATGAEGFQAGAMPPATSLLDTGLGTIDYSLLAGTSGQLPGTGFQTTGAEGLQLPSTPEVAGMGGGQGITVPVSGGTVTGAGLIPAGATPSLGDPGSFINDPNVLGQPVFPAQASSISITDALRGANLANQLMGGGQQTATGFPQQQAPYQPAGVDYSGIYGLLGQRPSVPGISPLLGPAQLRYPSLLG